MQNPTPSHGAKILLIEDDGETRAEIRGALFERGYEVADEATGPGGLAAARRGGFDLLIVDRMLPELDGLAVIETLRPEVEGPGEATLIRGVRGAGFMIVSASEDARPPLGAKA